MNIVLIGFMGTGKSAIGRTLARQINAILLDTDAEIERETGCGVPEYFARKGEAAFRALETSVLRRIAGGRGPKVVATGGGTPLLAENAALLQEIGTIILLTASPETILTRVGNTLASRPLLAAFQDDPLARIKTLMSERDPYYKALADYHYDTGTCDSPQTAATQLQRLLAIESKNT